MKTGIVIQARTGSSRLPGKTLLNVQGQSVLAHVIDRAKRSMCCADVIVATTINAADDAIVDICHNYKTQFFRGSETDVLKRYVDTCKAFSLDRIVRVTADNPLVGYDVIDYMIEQHITRKSNFTTNYHSKSFPNGTIVSIVDVKVLEYLNITTKDQSVREHIVTGLDLISQKFKVCIITAPEKWKRPDLRYCIDVNEDVSVVKAIFKNFYDQNMSPSTEDVINFLESNPKIKALNEKYAHKEY